MANQGLLPIADIRYTDVHNAFGFAVQPGYSGTDRLVDLGFTNTYENAFVRYDSVLNAAYAEPLFVPHHNLRLAIGGTQSDEVPWPTQPTLNAIQWRVDSTGSDANGTKCYLSSRVMEPWKYTGLYARMKSEKTRDANMVFQLSTLDGDGVPTLDPVKGFHVFKRHNASKTGAVMKFQFFVDSTTGYELVFEAGRGVLLNQITLDGETETIVPIYNVRTSSGLPQSLGQEQTGQQHDNFAGYKPVARVDQTSATLQLLGGMLQVWIHGQVRPLVVRTNATTFQWARVKGSGGRYAYFSIHPICFYANAYMVSNERNVGFVPSNSTPVSYLVVTDPLITGVTVSTIWSMGTEFRYQVTWNNPSAYSYQPSPDESPIPFSYTTDIVRSVSYRIAPIFIRRADMDRQILPQQANISITFDPQNLTIYSRATLVFPNRHGEWRDGWRDSGGGKGNRAMRIDLGWRTGTGAWVMNRRFTGIGGIDKNYHRGVPPDSTVTLTCDDLSVIPRENPMMNAPHMDGWCHLYAMRYLAWSAGIVDDQLDFEYCNDPFCTIASHYHLPMGEGNRPLVYFPPGTTHWAAMQRIRKLVGYAMYFDAYGKMRYYPWSRTSPGPYLRTYYEGNDFRFDSSGIPCQTIQDMTYNTSTEPVRTGVTVVGIDAYGPLWQPIVAHRENEDAIYDPYYAGYKGFRSPFGWADSMFANQTYADDAADTAFSVLSRPYETVGLEMLSQVDIFPLNVLGIVEAKTPASVNGIPKAFFVTGTRENIVRTREHNDYRMQVAGRWIV